MTPFFPAERNRAAERVEALVRTVVVPYERDPHCGPWQPAEVVEARSATAQ